MPVIFQLAAVGTSVLEGRTQDSTVASSVQKLFLNALLGDFSGSTGDKNTPAIAGDIGSVPGPRGFHMPRSN